MILKELMRSILLFSFAMNGGTVQIYLVHGVDDYGDDGIFTSE